MRNYAYTSAIAKVNKRVFETGNRKLNEIIFLVLERMEEAEIMKSALLESFKRAFRYLFYILEKIDSLAITVHEILL